MRTTFVPRTERDPLSPLDFFESELLTPATERETLQALGECKAKLAAALVSVRPADGPTQNDGDLQTQAHDIFSHYGNQAHGAAGAKLGSIYRRYTDLRCKLAMANIRLVAHMAKRFRDRGISYSDLIQEGFCGLLEAIDRFDVTHESKLATYATWWIRQAMQRAVASGAYPVRLSPRHLRQLAENQDEISDDSGSVSSELIQKIHAATRPAISLDWSSDRDNGFSLLQTMSDSESDVAEDLDMSETISKLVGALRPREQEVLSLRFGLGGKSRLSLSQVGKVLAVSKERVRQIQDRALEKLRVFAVEARMEETLISF